MENTTKLENWLDEEISNTTQGNYERLPSLKLEENRPTEITVDFSKKFEVWTDGKTGVTKAIIPVSVNNIKMNWWLNKANPLYRQVLDAYKKTNVPVFKVLQTGKQKETKYILIQ